jgi:hypothetical protein
LDPNQPQYSLGDVITVTAVPDVDWSFEGWSGDLQGNTNPTTLTINSNKTITALFTTVPTYTVTTNAIGSGSVLLDPDQPHYAENTQITISAVPEPGWRFDSWSGDLSGMENPATVNVDGNKSITANFLENLPLSLTVNMVGNGTTMVTPTQQLYDYGELITLTAAADTGWRFDSWESDPPIAADWWNNEWSFRLPVNIDSAGYLRTDAIAEFDVNFTTVLNEIGENGELDLNSLRIIEVDEANQLLNDIVPFQFDPDELFDASANAVGKIVILLTGNTGSSTTRYYHIYFDLVGKAFTPPSVPPYVTLTDNVMDEGLTTYRIDNANATYYYDKLGGGFSSIVDANGNDWINYNAANGASGTYRGIPNLVYPEGYMHPGDNNVISSIVSEGPLKTTIRSISVDNNWEAVWEFYPDFAQLTVLRANHNYWFLYEGTPGGVLDVNSDIVVRSDGTQTLASEAWSGDLAGAEWVYFGDPNVGRSLYALNHQQDSAVDSYYPMEGQMTVFGFGRQGISTQLSAVPASFTIGLVDDINYGTLADEINAAYQPFQVVTGTADNLNAIPSITSETFSFEITQFQIVTATFSQLYSPTLTITPTVNGSVSVEPNLPQYQYGQAVTVTAIADTGWYFSNWSGDFTHHNNPLVFNITEHTNIGAAFAEDIPLTLSVNIIGNGAVQLAPDQPTYSYGQVVTLTALADPDWLFDSWGGDITGSNNPINIVMNSDQTITATFIADISGDPDAVVILPMDEGTGTIAADTSGSGNDGTLLNGATYVADSGDGSPYSVQFDGVNDYVDLGPLDVQGSGLTLAVWMNADSFPGPSMDPRLISKATGTAGNKHVFMLSTVKVGSAVRLRARVRIGGQTTTLIANSGNLMTGVWHHTAATYDGTTLRLYLDGVEVGSMGLSGVVDVEPSTPVAVGAQPPGAGPRFFDGLLDDVRILQRGLSADEIVALAAGNQVPVANADAYGTAEDTTLIVDAANGVLANDSDPEGDPLQAVLEGGVMNGDLNLNPDGSFNYTPYPDFSGSDSFTYRASDGTSTSTLATVLLTVNPVNDPPIAADDSYETAPETPLTVAVATGVLANDNDPDGDLLQAVLVDDVANGVLNLNGDGSFTYTPATNFKGTDTFTYRANDATVDSNLATVTITVLVPPAAVDDAYTTDEDTMLMVPAATGVLANDVDNVPPNDLMAVLMDDVVNGVLNLNVDGSFTYTPALDFNGVDTFTYQAVDGVTGAYSVAIVTLTVDPVNDPPVAADDSYETAPETPLTVVVATGVLANDNDPDGDLLQAVLVDDVANGVLNLNGDGSFTYTPATGFNGTDTFTYRANDATVESNLATVTITISGDNSPPKIVSGVIAFSAQVIANNIDETHAVLAADLNADGYIDAVATDFIDDSVFWFENEGTGNFIANLIDGNLDGAYPAHVADVDLDGDIDVLAAGYLADTFVWYENDGSASFTRHDIDTAADGAHSIVTADLDLDGDIDFITTNQDGSIVGWYENDGSNNFSKQTIDNNAPAAKRAEVADADGDGDLDVFAAIYNTDEIAWYENDGNEQFVKNTMTTSANGAYYVFPADVDGDGDVDVFSASSLDNTIAWFENLGSGTFVERIIDTSARGARSVIATDVDGDGDVDAISASPDNDTVAWYANDGSGNFTAKGVDLAANGAYGLDATDMDGDGDIDILSAQRDANTVALHTHYRMHEVLVEIGGAFVINDTILQTIDDDDLPSELIYTIIDPPTSGRLELNGGAIGFGDTFTQEDINQGRVAYVHTATGSVPDGFSFDVRDGGENGVRPVGGVFSIIISGADDAVVHLPLDEGSGTVAGDISGLGNDGTLTNGAEFEANSGDGSPYSVRFDGLNDYIDLGSVDVNGSGLTLATWFNADSYPGPSKDPRLISKASGTRANEHVFMLSTVGSGSAVRLRARVRIGGQTTTLIASSGDLLTGVWHHAAVTYDGSFLRLYLDGVEVGSTPLSGEVDVDASIPVAIGAQPAGAGNRFFDGLMDDVRIVQRALSSSEIAAIATGEPIGNSLMPFAALSNGWKRDDNQIAV